MNSALFQSELMHHRVHPKQHRFNYKVNAWLFDLGELDLLNHSLSLFSRNRFNLFSFHDCDYGDGSGIALADQINNLLIKNSLDPAERISLLCYPRVLGYVFNPIAIYYCYRDEQLMAVVYEVSNTFSERHSYVIEVDSETASSSIQQQADKKLHVSPFFSMDCYYRFTLQEPSTELFLNIELFNEQQKLFTARLIGKRIPISAKTVIKAFTTVPFQTLKVVTAIHWQALKIWLKGIPIVTHKKAIKSFASSKGSMSK